MGPCLRLVKLQLLLCSIVLKSCGCREPALVRCNVRHVSKLSLAERITEVSTRLRLIRVDLHELLEFAADNFVLGLRGLLRLRQLGIHLLEAQVLFHTAMIIIQKLLCLRPMILAVLEIIEA